MESKITEDIVVIVPNIHRLTYSSTLFVQSAAITCKFWYRFTLTSVIFSYWITPLDNVRLWSYLLLKCEHIIATDFTLSDNRSLVPPTLLWYTWFISHDVWINANELVVSTIGSLDLFSFIHITVFFFFSHFPLEVCL